LAGRPEKIARASKPQAVSASSARAATDARWAGNARFMSDAVIDLPGSGGSGHLARKAPALDHALKGFAACCR